MVVIDGKFYALDDPRITIAIVADNSGNGLISYRLREAASHIADEAGSAPTNTSGR